ncbi:MAG: hypothetical protein R2682_08735 [Pyrinomonadaceae bacterium]
MKRKNQQTASAARFATMSELSRRGYDTSFTMGNTMKVDLFAAVPDGEQFTIQVKGISNRNGLFVSESFFAGKVQRKLYLVVVYVPPIDVAHESFEFYILPHKAAKREFEKLPKLNKKGEPYSISGLNWSSISEYRDRWDSFPSTQPRRERKNLPEENMERCG